MKGHRGGFNPFRDAHGRYATQNTHGRSFRDAAGRRLPPTDDPPAAAGHRLPPTDDPPDEPLGPPFRPNVPTARRLGDGTIRFDFHDPDHPERTDLGPAGFTLTAEEARPPRPDEVPVFVHEGLSAHLRPRVPAYPGDKSQTLVFFDADNHPISARQVAEWKAKYNGYAIAQGVKKSLEEHQAAEAAAEAKRDRSPGAPREVLTHADQEQYMRENNAVAQRMTTAQKDGVRLYQLGSAPLNDALRDGTRPPPEDQAAHEALLSLVRPTREAIKIFRGMNMAYIGGNVPVGTVFTDKGWTSTSLTRSTAESYTLAKPGTAAALPNAKGAPKTPPTPALFEITLPKGTPHAPLLVGGKGIYLFPCGQTPDVNRAKMSSGEIVLPPGTSYQITGSRQELVGTGRSQKLVTIYTAEVLPHDA